jgi:hypothetical protein
MRPDPRPADTAWNCFTSHLIGLGMANGPRPLVPLQDRILSAKGADDEDGRSRLYVCARIVGLSASSGRSAAPPTRPCSRGVREHPI